MALHNLADLTTEPRKPRGLRISVPNLRVKLSKMGLSALLFFEDYRLPPAESSLSVVSGVVDSVEVTSQKRGIEMEHTAVVALQDGSGHQFVSDQPAYHSAAALKAGDQVELGIDAWWLPHPHSIRVYSLSVNGQTVSSYQDQADSITRGGNTFVGVIFLLLGLASLTMKGWGSEKDKAAFVGVRWLKKIIGG